MDSTHNAKRLNFAGMELQKLRDDSLYRNMTYGVVSKAHITINSKKLLNLCSNDYLGIPSTKIKPHQLQSSSRLVSGNDQSYQMLECELARHKSHQSSLVYPTGYMANLGVIPSITKSGDTIFSDELNHASIIEACRLSKAKTIIYKHNDMKDLQRKIKQKGRKLLVTEGIFSMDGDYSALDEIAEISSKNDIITMVDDAHGDFVAGRDGKGTPNRLGVSKKIDLYTSSLSKGLGSFGGYVASDSTIIDLCINKSKSFIYTSALPSLLVEYSLSRLHSDRETRRKKLWRNTRQLARGLRQIGFDVRSQTHIIPIIIGDEKKTSEIGRYLLDNGIFAQPIRYPTVQRGMARLRLSVTAWLSKQDIERSLEVFETVFRRLH